LRNSLFPEDDSHPVNHLPVSDAFELTQGQDPLSLSQKVDLAYGILNAMGLTGPLAETVLLVGHGSSSCNNPHASGLDCGACGGQTGEINVRVLAYLLNDPTVRDGLRAKGLIMPTATRFVAAMHNTTTDEFTCFGEDIARNEQVSNWLARAGEMARQERSIRLGLDHLKEPVLHKSIKHRAKDWSQVRPEWGLSNNAAFIVAPRWRTRGINLQYYASVCDNHTYGSGNKVLHNVVDGCIGVFEGNGGDLRIGLPMQSLHDGNKWMHEPLRLSVYIDAPRNAIAKVVAENEVVRQLIDNEWLFCFRWDPNGSVERFIKQTWQAHHN
jgi:uncharacterized protein YbcC (UPF0753/DUF2309 family)